MSRYSPTVLPWAGPGIGEQLAHALENGVSIYRERQDRERNAISSGWHPGKPPAEPTPEFGDAGQLHFHPEQAASQGLAAALGPVRDAAERADTLPASSAPDVAGSFNFDAGQYTGAAMLPPRPSAPTPQYQSLKSGGYMETPDSIGARGRAQGQQDDYDHQVLGGRLAQAFAPPPAPREWKPTTMQEATDFYSKTHPQTPDTQLVQDADGNWVPVNKATGKNPAGQSVRGRVPQRATGQSPADLARRDRIAYLQHRTDDLDAEKRMYLLLRPKPDFSGRLSDDQAAQDKLYLDQIRAIEDEQKQLAGEYNGLTQGSSAGAGAGATPAPTKGEPTDADLTSALAANGNDPEKALDALRQQGFTIQP